MGPSITAVRAEAYAIPTEQPECDGTLSWDQTVLVAVHVLAGERTGFGYTYADASAAKLIRDKLADLLVGRAAFDIEAINESLWRAVRNLGRSGIAATAISALDLALWDLKARLLGVPLSALLGRARDSVEIYGSGGFTNYDDATLAGQLAGWVEREGCRAVKMKIGSDPARDPARIAAARGAVGERVGLFVDANGALSAREALELMRRVRAQRIGWFEEPVSSDDLAGLARVRAGADAHVDVAAGEYFFVLDDARAMLQADAVDVQQCDVTRCGGITGFLRIAALCAAFHKPLSGHCAPSAHLQIACAVPGLLHLEWFHDHVRIEQRLFDGAPRAADGKIAPDETRPGNGLCLKQEDAACYAI